MEFTHLVIVAITPRPDDMQNAVAEQIFETMKLLLMTMAIFEGLTGAALLVAPALTIRLLLGAGMESPEGLIAARIAGAAIFSLAILCATAPREKGSGIRVIAPMLFYNIAAEIVLVYAAAGLGLRSKLLWPAILVHQVLGVWCAIVLIRRGTTKSVAT